jgi:prepilin-type N-terminal cleavage/methylation domain-containing protein
LRTPLQLAQRLQPSAGVTRNHGFSLLEMLFTVALTTVIAAIAVPAGGNLLASLRIAGDARTLTNTTALAKLRAASDFTQSRVYVDLVGGTYHIETWQKATNTWAWEGGAVNLSLGVANGFLTLVTPPPNTQAAIAQSPQCLTNLGAAIAGTACVLFNSRGVPIDGAAAPTNVDALYITDGTTVYAVTVSATGFVQLWRSSVATPAWGKQ